MRLQTTNFSFLHQKRVNFFTYGVCFHKFSLRRYKKRSRIIWEKDEGQFFEEEIDDLKKVRLIFVLFVYAKSRIHDDLKHAFSYEMRFRVLLHRIALCRFQLFRKRVCFIVCFRVCKEYICICCVIIRT